MSPELVAFLTSWSWEPSILAGLAVSATLYAVGWARLGRRAGGKARPPWWRLCSYLAGLATIALALLSPIATYSELFFSMHMAQHLLLVMIAAPLIWLGAPLLPVLWALPLGLRRAVGGIVVPGSPLQRLFHALTRPVVAATLYVGALAIWHVPSFYDAAQGRSVVHDLEHVIFLGTALLYWWPVVHPTGGRRRLGYGPAIVYFFPAILEGNLIGALLTFADQPLYATYRRVPRVWDLSAVQDQQIGGLLMWVVGGLLYLVPILVLAFLLLSRDEVEESANREGERAVQSSPGRGSPRG